MSKRKSNRFKKRLEVTFTKGTDNYHGITSDLSNKGLFIRTRYIFSPGSVLDIKITLPDGSVSQIKGMVKRAVNIPISTFKNGLGIEITQKDAAYDKFVNSMDTGAGAEQLNTSTPNDPQPSQMPEYLIIPCSNCNAKNKVATAKLSLSPKCGKCGTALSQVGAI